MKAFKPIFLLSLTGLLLGCPKPNNSQQNQPAPTATTTVALPSCVNCQGIDFNQFFLITETTEMNQAFTLRMTFSGAPGTQGAVGQGAYYSGPAAVARGDLQVVQPLAQGSCQFPAGQYTVAPQYAGIYGSGIFQNLKWMASNGSVVIVFRAPSMQIASPNNRDQNGMLSPSQRLFSTHAVIESVNGQLCEIPVTLR
jgi:hypothetical protein